MKRRRALAAMIVALLVLSCTPYVHAMEPQEENDLSYGCFASQELAEKIQGALIDRGTERLQNDLGIETYSMVRPGEQHFTLMPSTGKVNMLVLIIAFSDHPEYKEAYNEEEYNRMLNAPYDPALEMYEQSVRGFYQWASYGKLDITATALPVYDAPHPSTYYENTLPNNLVAEALEYYYEQGVLDLAQFDNDKDGEVDAFVVNSLITSPKPAWRNMINGLGGREIGGYRVGRYAHVMSQLTEDGDMWFELVADSFNHEMGHLLGLGDNYNVSGTTNVLDQALYELMTAGLYVNTYYKVLLDWIEPIILTNDDPVGRIELSPVELYEETGANENKAVVLIPDAANLPFTEFYIAEYRRGGAKYGFYVKPIFDTSPGIVIWHCNTYYDHQRKDNTYFYRKDYLKSVYKSGSGEYGAKDIYVAGDEFSSDSAPDSGFYDGTYTGAYLKVEQVTPEKAVLRAGFREPNLNPAPVITISEPSVKVIKTGVETVITMTITAGDELVPVDTIKKYYDRLLMCYESETANAAGITFDPTKNPITVTYDAYFGGDGEVWLDLPGGAIQYNGKDSLPVTSEKIYVDNTPPEITLNGENPQQIQQGSSYIELGAVASDNLDPDIEGKLQIDASAVDINTPGSYTVTYSVTDHAGHIATAERTAIVEEGPPPHIHQYPNVWVSNDTNHWHQCDCGEKADLAAHAIVVDPAVPATCTTPGKTEGSHCSICEKVLQLQLTIDPKGHTPSAAWAGDEKDHWHTCSICGEMLDKAAHIWNAGTVTTAPTASSPGIKTYTCTVCAKNRTESIPATGGGGGGGGGGIAAPVTYDIALTATENGKVLLSEKKAEKGIAITVTVTPEKGYRLDKLTVIDARKKELSVTDKGQGVFTFTMPATKVTVTATFVKEEPVVAPPEESKAPEPLPVTERFTDVKEDDWFLDAVQYVVDQGLMRGMDETSFTPDAVTTRGAIVTVLHRMEGEPVDTGSLFRDVPTERWYANGVAWASSTGIVQGFGDGTFRPEEAITREQLVTILYRYAQQKGYDVTAQADLSGFIDRGQLSAYAEAPMAWAKAVGLITGTDWGGIDPAGKVTRAEMATLFIRYSNYVEGNIKK